MKRFYRSLFAFGILSLGLTSHAQNLQESFENSFPPTDWTVHNFGGPDGFLQYNSGNTGSKSARIKYSTSAHNDWLITAPLTISSSTDSIHFYAKKGLSSYSDQFHVRLATSISSDTVHYSTFLASNVEPGTSWTKYSYDLGVYNGQDIRVAVQAISQNEYYLYFDDFSGPNLYVPSCLKTDSIGISNLTATSVDISWSQVSGAQNYIYEIFEAPISAGNTPIISGVGSTNNYSASGLNSTTDYIVRIKTICSATDTSIAKSFEFTTPCAEYSDFTENFESTTTGQVPNCWSSYSSSSTTGSIGAYTYGSPAFGSKHLRIYNGSSSTQIQYAISPNLEDLGNSSHRIRFMAKKGGSEKMIIGTMSNPTDPSTFTLVDTINLTSTETEYIYNFDTPTTDNHIAFSMVATSSYSKVYIDEVNWEAIPSCLAPTSIELDSSSTNSLSINWNNPSSASNFIIEYGTEGFTLGTGTQVTATDTFKTIGSLNSATDYDFYVRNICSATDSSSWSNTATFTTDCEELTTINESFENTDVNNIPICWNNIVNSTSNYTYVKTATTGSPADGSKQIVYYNSSTGGNSDLVLVSPEFTNLNDKRVKFSARANNGTSKLIVGTLSNPDSISTFVAIDTFDLTNTHQEFDLPSTNTVSGAYLGFKAEFSANYAYGYIDHIRVEDAPTCFEPSAINSTILSTTEANISWSSTGSPTSWIIEYDTTNFTLGNGQTIITSSNPATLSNLTYGETYDVYIKSVCSANDSSAYSVKYTFTMECAPEANAFIEDFTTFLPNCWSLAKGELLTANSVITNDAGTSGYSWKADGYLNSGSTGAARINIYGSGSKNWLISPTIQLSAGHNKSLEFDAGLTDYNNSNAPDNGNFGSDDKVVVLISTDNGNTWGSSNALLTLDTSNAPSHTGQHYSLSLASYSGNVKIAFYAESTASNEDNDFFIDNFEISEQIFITDLGIDTININQVYCPQTDITPSILVENYGNMNIDSFAVNLTITGTSAQNSSEIITTSIMADSTEEISLSNISGLTAGNYSLTIEVDVLNDTITSNDTKTVTFEIEAPEVINLNSDTTICFGESITLFAHGSSQIIWKNGFSNGDIVTPQATTTYELEAISSNGCTQEKSVTVTVLPEITFTIEYNNGVLSSSASFNSYSWQFNGTVVGTSPNYTPTQNGEYILEVTNDKGCKLMKKYEVKGIGLEDINNSISVYPNPTNGIINFSSVTDGQTVEILNNLGAAIRTAKVKDSVINISALKAGIYYLRFKDSQQIFKISKI
jgi:hypothetical protein